MFYINLHTHKTTKNIFQTFFVKKDNIKIFEVLITRSEHFKKNNKRFKDTHREKHPQIKLQRFRKVLM